MSFIDRIKNLFNRITGKDVSQEIEGYLPMPDEEITKDSEEYINEQFPENELVSIIENGILDATSKKAEMRYKHNLEVLMKRTKEAGKVEKLMTIREDDSFPVGWEWDVLSKDTSLESTGTPLSYALKKAYALREAGIEEFKDFNGIKVPNISEKEITELMKNVDKDIGNFMLPSHFRSTRHLTINTPLEITGTYNGVKGGRNYIVIDTANNFFNSGYGYSIADHDAYLDVSHESLPISEEAIVLIEESKYDSIFADPELAAELSERRVIKYKGDPAIAISMVLTELGALPTAVGEKYAQYDPELKDIITNTFKDTAKENGLFYDKPHYVTNGEGHFTGYYDDQNNDSDIVKQETIDYLQNKFPDKKDIFESYKTGKISADDLVNSVGIDELLDAVDNYNQDAKNNLEIRKQIHKEERKNITPKEHQQFTTMVQLINSYFSEHSYSEDFDGKKEFDSLIKAFFHSPSIEDQKEAMYSLWEMLRPRLHEKESINQDDIYNQEHEEDEIDNSNIDV